MGALGLHFVLVLLIFTDFALSSQASDVKLSFAASERVKRESEPYYDYRRLPQISYAYDYSPEEIYIPPEAPVEASITPEVPVEASIPPEVPVEEVPVEREPVTSEAGTCNSESLGEVDHGTYLLISVQVDEEFRLWCENGYKFQGKAVCRSDGEFEVTDDFGCERITCPQPNEIANTKSFGDGPFYWGEMYQLECLPGYFPSVTPLPYVYCDDDGEFNGLREDHGIVCSPPVFQKFHVSHFSNGYCDGLCEAGVKTFTTICTNPYASGYDRPQLVDSACLENEDDEIPVFSEECTHAVLPECPDKNEPLWNVRTTDFLYYMQVSDCVYESNKALLGEAEPSGRFPERILQAKHYLKCGGIAEAIDQTQEFTISFIVKKTAGYWSYYDNNIIAYGKQGARLPILTFGTRRRNTKQLQLTAYLNGKRYRAFRIYPFFYWNRYAHVMISLGRSSLRVYVNGKRQGVSYVKTYDSRSFTESSGDSYFYMGHVGTLDYQPRTEGKAQQGDFSGSFSSLLMWNRAFTADEAEQTYMFYKQLIDEGNNAATTSVNLASHMQKLFKPRQNREWCMSEQKSFYDLIRENCRIVYDK